MISILVISRLPFTLFLRETVFDIRSELKRGSKRINAQSFHFKRNDVGEYGQVSLRERTKERIDIIAIS